jgi:hypothetical protein
MTPSDAKTVVTILSTNYVGSHFLSLVLGSHSQCMHLGEIRHRRRAHRDGSVQWCRLCADPQQCPLYKGITQERIGDVYTQVFANLAGHPKDVRILVDCSKTVAWAEGFVARPPYRMKYIHLIRDPRALVRRWRVSYKTDTAHAKRRERWRGLLKNPGRLRQWLFGDENAVWTAKWLYQNRRITRFLTGNRLDSLLVTYRDLARQPAAEVARICAWLGIPFEPAQLEYWRFEHHGTQKKEYESTREQSRDFFDTRWREFLTPEEQQRIVEDRGVRAYLARIGLVVTEDGLTRDGQAPAPAGGTEPGST